MKDDFHWKMTFNGKLPCMVGGKTKHEENLKFTYLKSTKDNYKSTFKSSTALL